MTFELKWDDFCIQSVWDNSEHDYAQGPFDSKVTTTSGEVFDEFKIEDLYDVEMAPAWFDSVDKFTIRALLMYYGSMSDYSCQKLNEKMVMTPRYQCVHETVCYEV